jgi:PKHD-type hydroxylase
MQLKNYYYWFETVLDPEVCRKIIELGESKIAETEASGGSSVAKTYGNMEKQSMPDSVPAGDLPLNEREAKAYVRDSYVAWLNDRWIYDIVYPLVEKANKEAGWNWDLQGSELFQFTKYNEGGFYGWHEDGDSDWNGVYRKYIYGVTEKPLEPNGDIPQGYTLDENLIGKIRKISMTINLNSPGEYEGGDLKFDFGMHTEKDKRFHTCEEIRPQGSVIVFPSFLKHCVTPVTKGTRYSLVLWTIGEPWK